MYRKLAPNVMVMKPAEDGMRLQCAKTLNWTTDRRIFVKGSVGASSVIVVRIGEEHPAQMRLATDDDVVQAFPANGPNQSFGIPVLPWRSRRYGFVPNAHRA